MQILLINRPMQLQQQQQQSGWAAHLRHLVRPVVRLGALQQLGCQVAVFPVEFLQRVGEKLVSESIRTFQRFKNL